MSDDNAEGGDDLAHRVRNWLEGEGYPLELRTARAFTRVNAPTMPSWTYVDPETGKQREIDVIATYVRVGRPRALLAMFVIECKRSKHPWVLICDRPDPRREPTAALQTRAVRGQSVDAVLAIEDILTSLRPCIDNGRFARNAVVALRSGNADSAYGAIMSCTKAADATVLGLTNSVNDTIVIAFPVIVLDARAFACWLGETDELHLEEVSTAMHLKVDRMETDGRRRSTTIDVVLASGLDTYASQCRDLVDAIYELM